MKKVVKITLTRVYKKEVEITVPNSVTKGMTDEEIQIFLSEEYQNNFEEEFEKAELVHIDHQENSLDDADTDRYDIYRDGKNVYGGHL